MRRLLLLAAAAALLGAVPAAAQFEPYRVPDDPAFTYLGAAPKSVPTVGTPTQLLVSMANGIDADGRVLAGLALNFIPWSPRLMPLPLEAITDPLKYAFLRTQVSIGTVRSAGDTASTDLGIGFRTALFDGTDYRRDRAFFGGLHERAFAACSARPPVEAVTYVVVPPGAAAGDTLVLRPLRQPGPPAAEAVEACMNRFAEGEIDAWRRAHWNASSLAVAAAGGPHFPGSQLDAARFGGLSAWAVGALRLQRWGQLSGQVRYDVRRADAGGDEDRQALALGTRLLFGSATVNGFAEWLYARPLGAAAAAPAHDQSWSAGVEYRVTPKLWFTAGVGDIYDGLVEGADRVVVLFDLRFTVQSASVFSGDAGSE